MSIDQGNLSRLVRIMPCLNLCVRTESIVRVARKFCRPLIAIGCALVAALPWSVSAQDEIEIAVVEREEPVDFDKDVLPLLRRSCLACHNASEAESDLILESAETILTGGSLGPAVEPGNADESLLLQVSAFQVDPVMPPEDNDVEAPPLTPEELGLIKLWIEQGAKASALSATAMEFEKLPTGLNPVYSIAMSQDGQYLAAGRSNQVFMYHLPSRRELTRLTDPQLLESGIYSNPGVAHLDLVQSMAFSPDGMRLATGGFRTVKIWDRSPTQIVADVAVEGESIASMVKRGDGEQLAFGTESGHVLVFDPISAQVGKKFKAHEGPVSGLDYLADGQLVTTSADKTIKRWNLETGELSGTPIDVPQPATSLLVAKDNAAVAVALSDNKIQVWSIAGFDREPASPAPTSEGAAGDAAEAGEGDDEETAAANEETEAVVQEVVQLAPELELTGHGKPATRLIRFDDVGNVIVSVSADSTARMWSLLDGKMVRQFNHGAPVADVVVNAEQTRLVTCGANKSVKIWDAQKGNQLHEFKGDLNLTISNDFAQRELSLRQRHVQLAKSDLDEANKRKTAEEENQKKADEALTVATTDRAAKKEAADQAVAAKMNADAELVKAQELLVAAQKMVEVATNKVNEANAAMQTAQNGANQAKTASETSTNQFRAALAELAPIRDSVEKDSSNPELLAQLQAKLKALSDLTEKQRIATEQKTMMDQQLMAATEMQQAAALEKQTADKGMAEAQAAIAPAEKAANDLAAPATKATDELTTAERNLASAQRTAERAKDSVAKATEIIPSYESAVASAEEDQKRAEEAKQQAGAALGQADHPMRTLALDAQRGLVFSGDESGQLKSWDLETAAPVESFDTGEVAISHATMVPSGALVLVGENRIRVIQQGGDWNLTHAIGTPDGESPFVDRVTALDFDPSGQRLAIGGGDPSRSGEIAIVDLASMTVERMFEEPHSDSVWCVRFSPDGKQLATSAADRFVKLFDVETGEFVRAFEGHTHHVLSVGWSADGRQLASSSSDKSVKIWDALTGDQKRTITGFGKEVTGIEFVSLDNNVAVSCGDKSVLIKRADNGGNIRGFGGFADFVFCVDVSSDGRLIAAGGQDSVVRVWTNDGKIFAELRPE